MVAATSPPAPVRRSKREHHPTARLVATSFPPQPAPPAPPSRRPQRRRAAPPAPARAPSPSRGLATQTATPAVRSEPVHHALHRRRMRAAAHATTTTSLVTRVYMEGTTSSKQPGKVLNKYTSQQCTVLCEVILGQLKEQTLASNVLKRDTSPACIPWAQVARKLVTHKLQMSALECQQLWKFLAYGQVPDDAAETTSELLPQSDEEEIQSSPKEVNQKVAKRRVEAAEEKKRAALKAAEEANKTSAAVSDKEANLEEPNTNDEDNTEVQTADKEVETVAADAPAEGKQSTNESSDNLVTQSESTTNDAAKSGEQTADKEATAVESKKAKDQDTAKEGAADKRDSSREADSQSSTGKVERLYPNYTLPMGASDSWHRPFDPKKSLSLTFVASRFLKRKAQPQTKTAIGEAVGKLPATHLPASTATGAVAVGVKKQRIDVGSPSPSRARVFTPSSTPPPAAKRARTQLEFFQIRLQQELANAGDKSVLSSAEVQRRFAAASVQIRRECQQMAVQDIERYNRELVRVRIWEKAVGSKSVQPKPQLASQMPGSMAGRMPTSTTAALLAHAAAVAAAASKTKSAGQSVTVSSSAKAQTTAVTAAATTEMVPVTASKGATTGQPAAAIKQVVTPTQAKPAKK